MHTTYYCVMDMGTTNTRLYLCREAVILREIKDAFGARYGKFHGKDALFEQLRLLLQRLFEESSVNPNEVECILAAGMAGSEIGLCEIPHIPLPADKFTLLHALQERRLDAITPIPFLFVPGLKAVRDGRLTDLMRGEETETVGIVNALRGGSPSVLILPGTHNKIIRLDATGCIVEFQTTMSGELLDGLVQHSILEGDVCHQFSIVPDAVLEGAEYAREYGLSAAVFHVRVMAKHHHRSVDDCTSFLYGAVLDQDTLPIRKLAKGDTVYVGGRSSLRQIYALLLGEQASPLSDAVASDATCRGLLQLYRLYRETNA